MRRVDVEVPKKLFDQAVEEFGSRKKLEDMLTIRLEANLRNNRALRTKKNPAPTVIVSVYIKDYLYPYFNELLIGLNATKRKYITTMIQRLLK